MSEVRRPRRRGLTVRMRLTLSYAGLVVGAGVLVVGVLFSVLRFLPDDENLIVADSQRFVPDRSDLLAEAVPVTLGGLGLLALVGLVGGWVLAGRMLQPLTAINDAARAAAAGSLSHRVDLPGPDDEFRQLADQFDRMLARLERSFDEQRRFTHHASHELRTPLAVTKAMLDVALADPRESGRDELLGRLAEMNDRSIHLLESLLQLARLERLDPETEELDLAEVVAEAARQTWSAGEEGRVEVAWDLRPAPVRGHRAMLGQLVSNLLRNAVEHNPGPDPCIWVSTGVGPTGGARLVVASTGAPLDERVVGTLTEPFVTGRTPDTTGRWATGSGLGLAIVASIARLHDARLTLAPREAGGLSVALELAAPADGARTDRPRRRERAIR